MSIPINYQREQIKKYYNLLVEEFIKDPKHKDFNIIFQDFENPLDLARSYKNEEELRATVVHEFTHHYLYYTIGKKHKHDDRFYSQMESLESWLDKNQGLSPRVDKSHDRDQYVGDNNNDTKDKENTCPECSFLSPQHSPRCSHNQNNSGPTKNTIDPQKVAEFDLLKNLLKTSKNLVDLKNNYQAIKNNPLYFNQVIGQNNKNEIDSLYQIQKLSLRPHIVAKGLAPFALGHDTGDSIRRPASYCGVVGFKPSYGLLSRAGVIPMASSLDTVGILAQKTEEIKSVFAIISQPDPHDLLTEAARKKIISRKKNKVALVEGIENHLPTELSALYHNTSEKLKKLGYTIEKITIPKKIREHLQITYLILCSSELVSHLNSLQGVTYGRKENVSIAQKRSKFLGEIVKQRTNNTAPPVANFNHSFSGLISSHWSDNLLLLANFAGLPSLSLPIGLVNGLSVSININSNYGQDKKVLELAEELEKKVNLQL
ncbi:6740_t:CDS:2 [Entrophospora sp. SA101]|nr:7410_t:CDS:2 [Entrophospora sp. SA101]CAJ0824663.1 6740_t:CDS:2 [Entrophospora sp. SA101]